MPVAGTMRLAEIINAEHVFAELPPELVKLILDRLQAATKMIDLNSTTELAQLGGFYCIRRQGEVLGWLELGATVKIKDRIYQLIKFIYFVPAARKTRAVGLFLLGLKKVLKHLLILGSDSYGGVLFKGGVELVKALGDSRNFTVSILDLRTGDLMPLISDDQLQNQNHLTLVFEENDFPLYHDAGAAGKIYLFDD